MSEVNRGGMGGAAAIGSVSGPNKQEIFNNLFNTAPQDKSKVKILLDPSFVTSQRNLQAVLNEHGISHGTWEDILNKTTDDGGQRHGYTTENLAKNLAMRPVNEITKYLTKMGETAFKGLPKEAQLAVVGVIASGVLAFKPDMLKELVKSLVKIKIAGSTISLKLDGKEIGLQFTNNKNFSVSLSYNQKDNNVGTSVSSGSVAGSFIHGNGITTVIAAFKYNFKP